MGTWVAQSVKHLPLAQVMIPGSCDGAPHQPPCSADGLLLPSPSAPPPACALLCSVSKEQNLFKIFIYKKSVMGFTK